MSIRVNFNLDKWRSRLFVKEALNDDDDVDICVVSSLRFAKKFVRRLNKVSNVKKEKTNVRTKGKHE